MSNRTIELQQVGDLQLKPSDFVNLVCSQKILSSFTSEELKKIQKSTDLEIMYRENQNG